MVSHPSHPLATRKSVDFKDLEGQVLLFPKSDCGYRMGFEQSLATERVVPATIIEMNSIEAIRQTIKAGIGITLIPEIAIQSDVEGGDLARLSWTDTLETGVLMIHYKDKWHSPAVEAFMDTARRWITPGILRLPVTTRKQT